MVKLWYLYNDDYVRSNNSFLLFQDEYNGINSNLIENVLAAYSNYDHELFQKSIFDYDRIITINGIMANLLLKNQDNERK